jgi:hypothetical protein
MELQVVTAHKSMLFIVTAVGGGMRIEATSRNPNTIPAHTSTAMDTAYIGNRKA